MDINYLSSILTIRNLIETFATDAEHEEIIREICTTNYVHIVSGNIAPYHVHMLLAISPR
jgi:REP element-mobilizing transposase RayT